MQKILGKLTFEFVFAVIWFGIYLYNDSDTALIISMIMMTGHSILTEIGKLNDKEH